jgi:hypothetical protein
MSAKRGHSLVELYVRQTRQEGIRAQRGLSNEAKPVRGDRFRDDLMMPQRKTGGLKVRPDLSPGWQVGVEHGPHCREKFGTTTSFSRVPVRMQT